MSLKVCPNCGRPLLADATACPACGQKLKTPESAPPAPVKPPEWDQDNPANVACLVLMILFAFLLVVLPLLLMAGAFLR